MHGRACDERKSGLHMWTAPNRTNSVVGGDVSPSSSSLSPANSFCKDGRKICVGDCALFKPPQDAPPFIGIIRWLTTGKEKELRLCVNWLYRPSEVKLGKGILLDAAPNEVFYSFHKDEIPAASLLHPCKVAFLAKGVELPSGIWSFVCRRVYDITNKCLWWLTDQDYINERQEEVDKLLYKTRIEMHATVQPGGRSPKPINGPTSTSQLKPGSENVHNGGSSFPSQGKGKKRERGDQGSEPIKRERYLKMDDGDSGLSRTESVWKSEISKFTDKGGLVDYEGVEKLVQLMLPDKSEKKIELVGRSVLASVVSATEKFDCLNRFVQLRGLPVFDEWLQEVHKGKIGDGTGSKDGEKSIEDFLLVLLRALDKLPVNLHALQMCNIGKSVNHLRTHKNLEIQKKARSLVDTWKKRVEAEMDAKSGSNQAVSWAGRPRLPEVSHTGNRHSGGSSDVAMKSSTAQLSASKNAPVKLVQVETMPKSVSPSPSPGSMKSAPSSASVGNNLKEGLSRNGGLNGGSEPPLSTAGDEKSSSSSQSHNNSQSCSSDHAKTGGYSGKEDARSSTAVSVNANKVSGGSSRHRKSMNGFPGPTSSVIQKETGSSRNSSLHRNQGSEKLMQSNLTCEKGADVPVVVEGNNHKLIVKLSNRGRSPARSASGGSFDDPSVMNSRASSPALSEKHDQLDRSLKDKHDSCRSNVVSDVIIESWQSNDFKEALAGSDEGDGSPATATVVDEDNCRTGDDARKLAEVSKAASSSSGNEHIAGKFHDASFSSMNALIESCVKHSEGNVPMSAADDMGMNLLASVATGEMSKSDMASPSSSPQRNVTAAEHSCTSTDSKSKSSPGDRLALEQGSHPVDNEHEKLSSITSISLAKNIEVKPTSLPQEKQTGPPLQLSGHLKNSCLQQVSEPLLGANVKSEETLIGTSSATNGGQTETREEKSCVKSNEAGLPDAKLEVFNSCETGDNKANVSVLVSNGSGAGSCDSRNKIVTNNELNADAQKKQKPPTMMHSECTKANRGELLHPSDSSKEIISENADEVKVKMTDEKDSGRCQTPVKQKTEEENNMASPSECKADSVGIIKNNQGNQHSGSLMPTAIAHEPEQQGRPRGSNLNGIAADEAEKCASAVACSAPSSAAVHSDMEAKLEFDLNEGFNGDDGKYGESNNMRAPESSTGVQLISPMPLSVSSNSTGLPASITVASAAKRPFVPPEDLLRNRGELGWKGSAATSAFRPAEPRKALEASVSSTSNSLPDVHAARSSRPPLDIDLNVADERILEDVASQSTSLGISSLSDFANNRDLLHDKTRVSASVRNSGGLDFDLNSVDEPTDVVNHLTSNGHRLEGQLQPIKPSSGGILNGEVSIRRDFDLNDGPLVDEMNSESSPFGQHIRSSAPSHSSVSGLRMSNAELGNFSSWFPQGNPYSAVTIQPILPDRGEQPFPVVTPGGPQRMLAPPTGNIPFGNDVYRGSVLSSSPAVPLTSTPFQYPVFPFGTNFPLPSASFSGGSTTYVDSSSGGRLCFPAMHSQVLAPGAVPPSHYPRPFVVSLPDGNNNGSVESSRKWGRQGLDLNSGPLGPEIDVRDEMSTLASRQLSVAGTQALADEQSRMYHVAGGGLLKRKEPDGGWESYKQSSWH